MGNETIECAECHGMGGICTHAEASMMIDDCPTGLDDCINCEHGKGCEKCDGAGTVNKV